jgi:hypothetical protein
MRIVTIKMTSAHHIQVFLSMNQCIGAKIVLASIKYYAKIKSRSMKSIIKMIFSILPINYMKTRELIR